MSNATATKAASKRRSSNGKSDKAAALKPAKVEPQKPPVATDPARESYLLRHNPYGLTVKEPGYSIANNLDDPEIIASLKDWRENYLPELGGGELIEITIGASIAGDSAHEVPVTMKVSGPVGTIEVISREIERTVARFVTRLRAGMIATRRDVTFTYDREIEGRPEAGELARIRKERMPGGKDHFRLALEIADTIDGDYDGGAFAVQRFHIEANRGTIERAAEAMHELVAGL